MLQQFVTITDICESLGVSRVTVKKWLKRGDLRGYFVGGTWRIALSDLEAFIGIGSDEQAEKAS